MLLTGKAEARDAQGEGAWCRQARSFRAGPRSGIGRRLASRARRRSPSPVRRLQTTECPGIRALAIRVTQAAASNSLFKIKFLCFGAGHWPTPYSSLKPEVLSSM